MEKPFAKPEQEFLMVANVIIDQLMREMSPYEFVILLAIFRKTRGWQKEEDYISFTQLLEITGIGSRATIAKHTKQLEERKMIIITRNERETNLYRLNSDYEIDSSRNELGDSSRNELDVVQEMNSQNTINKEKDIHGLTDEQKLQLKNYGMLLKSPSKLAQALNDYPPDIRNVVEAFCKAWNMPAPTKRMKNFSLWIKSAREIKVICQDAGLSPVDVMQELHYIWKTPPDNRTFREDYEGDYPVYGITSIRNTVWMAVTNLVNKKPRKP